jgi:hypothetical protein
MKNVIKCGALLATFIFLAVLPAHADSGTTLSFDLTGPVTASWTMSSDPTITPVMPGIFSVDVTDFTVNGETCPGTIYFFSLDQMGGFNSSTDLTNLMGDQLYMTDSDGDPIFYSHVFYLTNGDTGAAEILTVQPTPEPTTLLLLGSGLAALALKRKRQQLAS